MLQGVYSAATALDAAARSHEMISRNLAHINVPGYRRSRFAMEQLERPSETNSRDIGANLYTEATDFTAGTSQSTTRPLDFALNGDGFFRVQGPEGPLYTRNGVFQMSADGELVTNDGRAVLGSNGPIKFPPDTTPADIVVGQDGAIRVGQNQVGQLDIVKFANNHTLIPVGTTLFQAPTSLVAEPSDALVQQGARESSNVSAVEELVGLIVSSRYFEAAQRAMTTISDTIHHNTNPDAG